MAQQGKAYTTEEREQIVQSLKKYFLLGYSITKACEYAGFNHQTVYNWVNEDSILYSKIRAWQGEVNAKAREVIAKAIVGDKEKGIEPDLNTAKWWAERTEKETFSTRQDNLNTNVNIDMDGIRNVFDDDPDDKGEGYNEEQQPAK
jgi:transposase-like protein